jgi:hypothetical protein
MPGFLLWQRERCSTTYGVHTPSFLKKKSRICGIREDFEGMQKNIRYKFPYPARRISRSRRGFPVLSPTMEGVRQTGKREA